MIKRSLIDLEKGEIAELIEKLKPEIDKTIEKYLPRKVTGEWLEFSFGKPRYAYNLEAAQKSIIDPVWDFLDRGGKRWRPLLFLLIVEAVGGDVEKLKDFAIIPEIIHNGTLIIDDIEDQGELRRGNPCLHKIFGEDIAINVGNFMYYFPLLVLMRNKDKFDLKTLTRAYEVYIQEMINDLGYGQATDIYWHKGEAEGIKEEEYLQMCAHKTGNLVRMAAKMAVILSNGSNELAEKIGKFAEAVGIAFQIQDDIMDITSTGAQRERFGKAFGNDIKEGKRTLVVIRTLENAKEEDKKRLLQILNKHTDDMDEKREAIEIIEKYDGVGYAKKRAEEIIKEAWDGLDELLEKSKAKKRLKELMNYLIYREV